MKSHKKFQFTVVNRFVTVMYA